MQEVFPLIFADRFVNLLADIRLCKVFYIKSQDKSDKRQRLLEIQNNL